MTDRARQCLKCSASLTGMDSRARLCSAACRDAWNKEKMRQWRTNNQKHLKTYEKKRCKQKSEQARERYAKDGERINAVARRRKRRNAEKINQQQRERYRELSAARQAIMQLGFKRKAGADNETGKTL